MRGLRDMSDSRRFFLSIADILTEISAEDPEMHLCLDGAVSRFRVAGGDPDVRVRARWGAAPERRGRLMFDSGGPWRAYREDGSLRFEFTSPLFGADPYAAARFSPDLKTGDVYLRPEFYGAAGPVYPLQYPLDELLMVHLLAQGKGLEVHGCGAVDSGGRGYLLSGQSGRGKTTVARFWAQQAGAAILSDDRIIVRKDGDVFWMYGTPWHGEGQFASAGRSRLKRIIFLRHGGDNRQVQVSGAAAAAALFSCVFPTFHSREGLEFTLGFCEALTRSIPCYELRFVPDGRIVEFLQATPD